MMTYEIVKLEDGSEIILATDANGKLWTIPKDPANSDYQRYLNPETDNPVGGN
jgi:hypothetical protein